MNVPDVGSGHDGEGDGSISLGSVSTSATTSVCNSTKKRKIAVMEQHLLEAKDKEDDNRTVLTTHSSATVHHSNLSPAASTSNTRSSSMSNNNDNNNNPHRSTIEDFLRQNHFPPNTMGMLLSSGMPAVQQMVRVGLELNHSDISDQELLDILQDYAMQRPQPQRPVAVATANIVVTAPLQKATTTTTTTTKQQHQETPAHQQRSSSSGTGE